MVEYGLAPLAPLALVNGVACSGERSFSLHIYQRLTRSVFASELTSSLEVHSVQFQFSVMSNVSKMLLANTLYAS